MSSQQIGRVTSGRTKKSYDVRWDSATKEVYVSYSGGSRCGKANSAGEAMNVAEAFLYDK